MAHRSRRFYQDDPSMRAEGADIRKILVIFSAHESAKRAFAAAVSLARRHAAGLEIVALVGFDEASDPAARDPLHDGSAFRTLARMVAMARGRGLKASSRILLVHARISDVIVDEARRTETDLIILGPLGDDRSECVGELAKEIRQRLFCSLLVVKASGAPRAGVAPIYEGSVQSGNPGTGARGRDGLPDFV